MIRALIFDCFGVFYTDPVFAYMRDPRTPPEKAEALHELDTQAAYGKLSKAEFVRKAATLLNCQEKDVEDRFFVGRDRNHELVELLQQLRKQYKVGLLSNIGGDMMDGFFAPAERKEFFDDVILSGEVKMAKPDPGIFKLALSRLGTKPDETIFIDDSQNHVAGARELGIASIQFLSNSQLKAELPQLGLV